MSIKDFLSKWMCKYSLQDLGWSLNKPFPWRRSGQTLWQPSYEDEWLLLVDWVCLKKNKKTPLILNTHSSGAVSLYIVFVMCLFNCRSSALHAGYCRGFPSWKKKMGEFGSHGNSSLLRLQHHDPWPPVGGGGCQSNPELRPRDSLREGRGGCLAIQ